MSPRDMEEFPSITAIWVLDEGRMIIVLAIPLLNRSDGGIYACRGGWIGYENVAWV